MLVSFLLLFLCGSCFSSFLVLLVVAVVGAAAVLPLFFVRAKEKCFAPPRPGWGRLQVDHIHRRGVPHISTPRLDGKNNPRCVEA